MLEMRQLKAQNERNGVEITLLQSVIEGLREEICVLKSQLKMQSESLNNGQQMAQEKPERKKPSKRTRAANKLRRVELFQNLDQCFTDNSAAWTKCNDIVETLINHLDI